MSRMGCMRLLLGAVGGLGLMAFTAGPARAEAQPDEGGVTVVRAPGAAERAALDAGITNDIKAKLENVVNAPQKPTTINNRHRGSSRVRSVAQITKKPTAKLPLTLITSVP